MKELAKITLELDHHDINAFAPFDYAKKRNRWHQFFRIKTFIIIALGFLGYFLLGGFSEDVKTTKNTKTLLFVVFTTLAVAAFEFIMSVMPELKEEFTSKENKLKDDYSGMWRFTAFEEGLFVTYNGKEKLILWKHFDQIEANENSLYLKFKTAEHLILSRKNVLTGNFDEFANTLLKQLSVIL